MSPTKIVGRGEISFDGNGISEVIVTVLVAMSHDLTSSSCILVTGIPCAAVGVVGRRKCKRKNDMKTDDPLDFRRVSPREHAILESWPPDTSAKRYIITKTESQF